MKVRKRWITVVAFLLAGSVQMDLAAQETIEALVKKCENLNGVKVNIVRNRHPETKEVTRSIMSITIPVQSNQELVDDFVMAFQKEKENAEQEMENKENGKWINLFYRFEKKSYSLMRDDGGNVIVNIRENTGGDRMVPATKRQKQQKEP
ncbi:MAG: DUF5024 domain-containing protein [Tannerella sp.]|jgi:hypothetical protein|nr:DUF5024 domain-containing protein [Tannerella sp.]